MAKAVSTIKNISHFLNTKLWRLRLDKLSKKQSFFVKQLRVFMLAIKGFNEDNCLLKASALTYYTLFSIVPVIALAFAIAKGFGYQEDLKKQILERFGDQQDVLMQAFEYADKMLANTHGGLIAGIGVVVLLWSVMKLLSSIENSFNDIWEIKRDRTWVRKVTDYLSIMLIAPIFLVLSGTITVGLKTSVEAVTSSYVYLDPVSGLFLKLLAFTLIWGIFVFIYIALPNTKVKFVSAAKGALVAAVLFELLQWAYVASQVGVAQYNAIYGSFAALPLFLIWVQYSWYVMLFGSELSYANQNVDNYELENDISNISDRYKRVIALLIANLVVKNFNDGKPAPTDTYIAKKLDLPIRLARTIILEFVETGIFNEVKTKTDKETGYQPGISDSKLTVKYIIDKIDEKGINELPIENSKELAIVNRLMKDMDDVLNTSKGNTLVKDLA
ncbi:MAG: ribonuclease BN/unknown domain fusion protein [Bacteroidota bacterium]|jgi:membrane protein|nr:ribonuclease BN/unknown domain fusion protein [Bacteroidota bacterium]